MQPGFGSKKNKKKGKKSKNKKSANADGAYEVDMTDAQPASTVPVSDDPDNLTVETTVPLTAKDKQKRKMELKSQLKVRVKGLKHARWVKALVTVCCVL